MPDLSKSKFLNIVWTENEKRIKMKGNKTKRLTQLAAHEPSEFALTRYRLIFSQRTWNSVRPSFPLPSACTRTLGKREVYLVKVTAASLKSSANVQGIMISEDTSMRLIILRQASFEKPSVFRSLSVGMRGPDMGMRPSWSHVPEQIHSR